MNEHIKRCGKAEKLMKDISNESIDLILTDPPYKNYQSHRTPKKINSIDKQGFNFEWLMNEINRVLKSGKHFYVWCDFKTYPDAFNAIKNTPGLTLKNMIVWVKTNHGSGDLKSSYAPQHEICIFGHKGKGIPFKTKRNPDVLFKKNVNSGCISFGSQPIHLTNFLLSDNKIKISGHSVMMGYLNKTKNQNSFFDKSLNLKI